MTIFKTLNQFHHDATERLAGVRGLPVNPAFDSTHGGMKPRETLGLMEDGHTSEGTSPFPSMCVSFRRLAWAWASLRCSTCIRTSSAGPIIATLSRRDGNIRRREVSLFFRRAVVRPHVYGVFNIRRSQVGAMISADAYHRQSVCRCQRHCLRSPCTSHSHRLREQPSGCFAPSQPMVYTTQERC